MMVQQNGIRKKKKAEEMEKRLSTTQREILNVSRMMKVVVCAPERVADLLDAREYLSATLMYFRALRSYTVLSSSQDPVARCVLKSVPLVERQWLSMAGKPAEICRRCWEAVSEARDQAAPLSLAHCAASLASVLLLKKVQPEVLVRDFFEHRTAALLDSGNDAEDISVTLSTFVDRFISTFTFANTLFCSQCVTHASQEENGESVAVLQRSLMSKIVARLDRQRCLPKDVDEFMGDLCQSASMGAASFVADDVLHGICKGWLAGATNRVKNMIRTKLAGVKTLTLLRAVAEAIRSRITTQNASSSSSSSSSRPSWNVVACTMLENDFDLWGSFFCEAFKERTTAIITAHCDALTALATKLVGNLSSESNKADEDKSSGSKDGLKWNSSRVPDVDKLTVLKDGTSVHPSVEAFVTAMEQALSMISSDVAKLGDLDGPVFFGGAFCGIKKNTGVCLERMLADIAACLDARSREANSDSVLVLRCGQVAQAVLQSLPSLHKLCRICGASPSFVPLASVYGQCLCTWITRSLAEPLDTFREQLGQVQWLEKITVQTFRNTFESAPGAESEHLLLPAFLTPCLGTLLWNVSALMVHAHVNELPRPAALFLCRVLSDAILAAYSNVAETLSKQVAGGAHLDAEIAVQLWFDTYAIGELFNSRVAFVDPSDPVMRAVAASMTQQSTVEGVASSVLSDDEWPKRVAKTLSIIQGLMDPVECGFFKPHMRSCVLRCLQRSALVFAVYSSSLSPPGVNLSTTTTPASSPARGQLPSTPAMTPQSAHLSAAAASMVPCARVAPRFALLPSTSSITIVAAALTAPWTAGGSSATSPHRATASLGSSANTPVTPVRTPHRRFGSEFFLSAFAPSTPLSASSSSSGKNRTEDDDAMLLAMSNF